MGGVTSLGIRYPVLKEVVEASDFQDMAEDIDGIINSLAVKRALIRKRLSAKVRNTLFDSVPAATNVTLTYDTEDWDVGSISDLGVANDRLTLVSGVWLIHGLAFSSSWTTETMGRLSILVNGATVNAAAHISTTGAIADYVRATGLLISGSDGDYVGLRARWVGTGGPALWSGRLSAIRLRGL